MGTRLSIPVSPLLRDLHLNLDLLFPADSRPRLPVDWIAGPIGHQTQSSSSNKFQAIKAQKVGGGIQQPHRYAGVWGEKWKMGLFLIGEIPLAIGSLYVPMSFDLHRRVRGSEFGREALLASWTSFGTFTGAAIGNITCAALDWEQETPFCDLIGGVLGGLAGYFIADHVLPQRLSSRSRAEHIHERVILQNEPVLARPVENPSRPDRKNPVDPHGP